MSGLRTTRRTGWTLGVLGAVLVLAVALGVAFWPDGGTTRHRAAAPSTRPTPTHATPTPQVKAQPRPVAKIRYVKPSAPHHFLFSGPRFRIPAYVCSMPFVTPVDPPGEQEHRVCWIQSDFGVAPGSHTATSYVFGHSWAENPKEVLNRASAPATRQILHERHTMLDGIRVWPVTVLDGYHVTLWTRTGKLVYTVRNAFGAHKADVGHIRNVMNQKIPRRVTIITCAELGGVDYDYDVIINAFLTSATPRHAATD